jgi:hypothetical protein
MSRPRLHELSVKISVDTNNANGSRVLSLGEQESIVDFAGRTKEEIISMTDAYLERETEIDDAPALSQSQREAIVRAYVALGDPSENFRSDQQDLLESMFPELDLHAGLEITDDERAPDVAPDVPRLDAPPVEQPALTPPVVLTDEDRSALQHVAAYLRQEWASVPSDLTWSTKALVVLDRLKGGTP